jgi:hypothetical protein
MTEDKKLNGMLKFENIRYKILKRDDDRVLYQSVDYPVYKLIPYVVDGKKYHRQEIECYQTVKFVGYIVYFINRKISESGQVIEKEPKENDFGKTAWTFFDLQQALDHYELLDKATVKEIAKMLPSRVQLLLKHGVLNG